jgi:hypothetical protein
LTFGFGTPMVPSIIVLCPLGLMLVPCLPCSFLHRTTSKVQLRIG